MQSVNPYKMMRNIIILFTVLLLYACSPSDTSKKEKQKSQLTQTHEKESEWTVIIRDRFRHEKLDTFGLDLFDEFNQEDFQLHYRPIYGKMVSKVLPEQEDHKVDSLSAHDYYMTWQTDQGHIGFTTIGIYDGWRLNIVYRSYNTDGKFINEFELATEGGDEGYSIKSFGHFVNDSIYHKTVLTDDYDIDKDEYISRDTTCLEICIGHNGVIDTLSIN